MEILLEEMKNEQKINKLKELVSKFKENEDNYIRSDYNEAQLRSDYINPFFNALGWDVENEQGLQQNLREVIQEAKVKVEKKNKKPDYAFRVRGIRKYFVETKKPSVNILSDVNSAFQLRRYGWSARLPISVLTNFRDLIIYDCRVIPKEGDNPRVARIHHFAYKEFEEDFDKIYEILSKESVFSGKFDKRFELKEIERDKIPIDEYFLSQIDSWREKLSREIISKNKDIKKEELNYLVQNFLNRLVFLRICEDRELETYESLLKIDESNAYNELLKLFKIADEKYNSGLFNFTRDKLSTHINVGNTVILNIIKELYYPRSPYIFSVVESNVLGDIYELFLKKEIEIVKNRNIVIVEKPEAARNKSIVTTPNEVIDEILKKTVNRNIEEKTPNEIKNIKIADICCGSGAFLLAAYQCLLDYLLNFYIRNQKKFNDKIYKGEGELWYLHLHEKREILLKCIFGVDIDENAVEVTKFGLLIKLLENENVQTIINYNSSNRDRALPELENNIKVGNSLIDRKFYKFKRPSSLSEPDINKVNAFDWERQFPRILKEGGFDIIIGNPPYTRIQILNELYPLELQYYQSKYSDYICSKKDNFDKYYLFIERGLKLLKDEGRLGFITPHKFTKIKAGESLREIISSKNYLEDIVHFGKEQIFGSKATTYTCILILKKNENNNFMFEPVPDFFRWKNRIRIKPFLMDSSELSKNPWIFIYGPLKNLISKISRVKSHLKDETNIYVGLQTSKDEIYILRPEGEKGTFVEFTDWKGRKRIIEKDLLRPSIYDLTLEPFLIPKPNSMILFPYRLRNGGAELIPPKEMKNKYKKAWEYLNDYKKDLKDRNIQQVTPKTWYRFGRSQSLTKFDGREHLVIKVLGLSPTFCFDPNNLLFTGGGNGPYYGISIKPDKNISIFYVQGVLNSPLLDLYVHSRSSIFRGGYFSYGKQFIEEFPLKIPNLVLEKEKARYEKLIDLVQKINSLVTRKQIEKIPIKIEKMGDHINILKEELNHLVYDIYDLNDEERDALKSFEI